MSKQINWHVSVGDHMLIVEIAKRAVALAAKYHDCYLQRDAVMDLNACHANGCPLQLIQLLAADDGDFGHDVFGIRRHLNRSTGQLEDHFLPRYANLNEEVL